MAQLTGSGPGNGINYAMVDNSVGTDVGRLWTDATITGSVDTYSSSSGTNVFQGTDPWITITDAGSSAMGVVSTSNSTTTPLLANGSFVGAWEEVKDYSIIYNSVRVDEDSADTGTYGLNLEFSQDGTDVDVCEEYFQGSGAKGSIYSTQPSARYFRINYINGATDQGLMRMQTMYRPNYGKPSSHRIDDPIGDQNDAELTKAVLTAKGDDGVYANITATSDNSLRVTNIAEGLSIARGEVANTSFVHKFGAAPDFDTGDGFVTVWDGAEEGEPYELMNYVYSTSANIDHAVAQSGADIHDIEIQGLDGNGLMLTQTITLNGQTPVEIGSAYSRVFRMKNVNSVPLVGHITCYVSGAATGGFPDDPTNVRAVVHPENNQTEMAVYTIPSDKTGYMRSWYASTAGAKKDSAHTIKLLARPSGGVFQLKHKANIDVNGVSYIQHEYVEPEVFGPGTDIEMQMDTNQDAAGVAAGFDIVLINN